MKLVEKEAVINMLHNAYMGGNEFYDDLFELAEKLPTVERMKGNWIFEPKDAIELMFIKPKCSKCGYESADGGNFCSNCGADMRGEVNETD